MSLTLLAERIHFAHSHLCIHETVPKRYLDLMFYPHPAPLQFSPDILYIVRGIPHLPAGGAQPPGLICIVGEDAFSQAKDRVLEFSCNCLLIACDLPMEEIFNEIHSRILFLRRQIEIFKTAVYTQQSLQRLIEMIYDIMGNPAYLVDSSFKVLAIDRGHDMRELSAAWRRLEDEGYLPFDLVSNLISSGELCSMESEKRAVIVHSRYFYVPFINYNLTQGGKIKGHLFIAGMKKTISPGELGLAEYLGDYVLELLQKSPRFQNERGDYYEHFMRDLFSGRLTEPDKIRQQMASLGARPEEYFTVAVLHTSAEHGLSDERIASQMERCSGAKPVFYQDKIAVLFKHGKKPDAAALERGMGQISTGLDCEIGISDTFQGFYDLHTYYLQAEWALTCPSFLKGTTGHPMIRYYEKYAVGHILYVFSKNEHSKSLILPGLSDLYRYDRENHTELLRTLHVYLLHERSSIITSRLLHIHRNTLSYRIDKILDLCGFDLDDPAVRQRLLLSLEAIDILGDTF